MKGSGSACWQGRCVTEHLAFGRRDSVVSIMFLRYFVSLHFSDGVQLRQATVEGLQAKLENIRGPHEGG